MPAVIQNCYAKCGFGTKSSANTDSDAIAGTARPH